MDKLKRKLIKISELFSFCYPRSYSQEGEDMVIKELFFKKKDGFFVDIGAHHPKRFSNTYHYYRLGWNGVNIDAMPGSMRLFKWLRRRDINLEVGIGGEEGELTFFIFDEPAVNTFSEEAANLCIGKYNLIRKKAIKVYPLSTILEKYTSKEIDIMSIDVEGMDLIVLKSNDWQRFCPKVILVESFLVAQNGEPDEIASFLFSKGYEFYACTRRTTIFLRRE